MNVAILIGVSDYSDPSNNLPACKADVALMEAIIRHTGRFEDVLSITKHTTSSKLKTRLSKSAFSR